MEEIDQTISGPTEEEMEMMMDKFPELHTTPYNDVVTYDHQLNSNLFTINTPYFLDTPQTFPPPTPYFLSSTHIPFPNTQFQDHIPPPPQIDLLNNKINNNNNKNITTSNMAAMREMIFRIAAMQPIHIDPEAVKPPKRRNVKISKDPQSVAARHRRERISERIRILQRLVPGGTKMDTASMLDEAIHYVKFLKTQIQSLERASSSSPSCCSSSSGVPVAGSYHFPSLGRGFQDVEDFGDA